MDKKEFIDHLKSSDTSYDVKLRCCEFFINNYPVYLQQFNGSLWTKIVNPNGGKIQVTGGTNERVEFNFNKLQSRIKELEDYDT